MHYSFSRYYDKTFFEKRVQMLSKSQIKSLLYVPATYNCLLTDFNWKGQQTLNSCQQTALYILVLLRPDIFNIGMHTREIKKSN